MNAVEVAGVTGAAVAVEVVATGVTGTVVVMGVVAVEEVAVATGVTGTAVVVGVVVAEEGDSQAEVRNGGTTTGLIRFSRRRACGLRFSRRPRRWN